MKKYCVVSFGEGVVGMKPILQIASCPKSKISYLNADGLTVATFISNFSKLELYKQFDNVANISYILTEVDDETLNFETEEISKKMFDGFDGYVEEPYIPEIKFISTSTEFIEFLQIENGLTQMGIDVGHEGDNTSVGFFGMPFEDDGSLNIMSDDEVKSMSEKEKKVMIDDILLAKSGELSDSDKINLKKLSK